MKNTKFQKGQSIILLIFFVLAAITITITAIFMLVIGTGSTTDFYNGIEIGQLADSGAENALLRLERDPYYSGETYMIGSATVLITVVGDTTKIIQSRVTAGDFVRQVEVSASYVNNILRVTSWKEVF